MPPVSPNSYSFIFITFQGYSNGFIDLTYSKGTAYCGENIAISREPLDFQAAWSWLDDHMLWKHVYTDVWILNNIGKAETSPFEKSYFELHHTSYEFPVGPFKSSFMPWYGYMNVEMDVFKGFPSEGTTEKVNFSTPLSTQYINTSKPSIFTVFHVTPSNADIFPIFAIRVHFIENVICSANNHVKLSSRIYTIEDILDVYVSRNHPFKDLFRHHWHYDGYNWGTCRALIPDHKCSQSVSHYQIIRIRYHPIKALPLPHEINISMKKTVNCSIECSLDIGILEYRLTDEHDRTFQYPRYHEFRNIYRLTWQVIAAKYWGFVVTINSECDVCRKLCDVAARGTRSATHK